MKQGNFIYMLVGLLILLVIAPTFAEYLPEASSLGVSLTFISILFIGVWSLYGHNLWFYTGFILAIFCVALSILNFFLESENIRLLSLFVVLLFCILSVVIAMKQILFSGQISANKLVGSVCIYLLIGVIWAIMYILIDLLTVDAFRGLSIQAENQSTWEYIYFSFVTLTTLGYGDISPVNEVARTLTYIEAICGQFYIAILVASLVGAHMSDRLHNKN
jgi:voltage-gated potassium channel